jgi:hypothetical protein
VLAAAALLALAAGAQAQTAAYKCVSRGGNVTYSQVPCPGARPVTDGVQRASSKNKEPPQDRARIARRALLSPQDRQECYALDGTMREQEAQLKARGDTVTIQDEMPLVQNRKRFRELRC